MKNEPYRPEQVDQIYHPMKRTAFYLTLHILFFICPIHSSEHFNTFPIYMALFLFVGLLPVSDSGSLLIFRFNPDIVSSSWTAK